jgi:hypothetical protein
MQLEIENLQLKQQIKHLEDCHTSKPLEETGAIHVKMLVIKENLAQSIQQQQKQADEQQSWVFDVGFSASHEFHNMG